MPAAKASTCYSPCAPRHWYRLELIDSSVGSKLAAYVTSGVSDTSSFPRIVAQLKSQEDSKGPELVGSKHDYSTQMTAARPVAAN